MNLQSIFLREHDRSECGGGYCRKDERCTDTTCEGNPCNTRRVQEADLRWTDGIPVGYESGGIWYAEPEPEVASVADAIVRGLLALLAIAIIIGAAGFLIYTLVALP